MDAARGMFFLHSQSPPSVYQDLGSPTLLVDDAWRVKVRTPGDCCHHPASVACVHTCRAALASLPDRAAARQAPSLKQWCGSLLAQVESSLSSRLRRVLPAPPHVVPNLRWQVNHFPSPGAPAFLRPARTGVVAALLCTHVLAILNTLQ